MEITNNSLIRLQPSTQHSSTKIPSLEEAQQRANSPAAVIDLNLLANEAQPNEASTYSRNINASNTNQPLKSNANNNEQDLFKRADLNGDNQLNIFDFLTLQNYMADGSRAGDINKDGVLDVSDFRMYQSMFEKAVG